VTQVSADQTNTIQ
jgi:hypothetical protein